MHVSRMKRTYLLQSDSMIAGREQSDPIRRVYGARILWGVNANVGCSVISVMHMER